MKTIKQYLGKVSITCNGTWDINRQYDRLCLVNDGFFASYISRVPVPVGTPLENRDYWQPVASLKDDAKIHTKEFEKNVLQLIANIQLKLKSARITVQNIEERDSLMWNEVGVGCEVYVIDTKQSWILDSIVCSDTPEASYKEWHLEADGKIDSEEKYELEGQFNTLTADRAICDALGNIIHDTYISREAIKNYTNTIISDFLDTWRYEIQNGTITYDMLSDALKQLLEANGTEITNLPDEEDLTVKDNQLKFKDREYQEENFTGKGYKILRKNWVGNLNLLEQSMINDSNTIYEVRYLFCLDGGIINIPFGSILKFDGGQFNNGTIVLNETPIIGIYKLSDFGTTTISGTFAKGQLLYIDDREAMCYWNGNKWINIADVKLTSNLLDVNNLIDDSYLNGFNSIINDNRFGWKSSQIIRVKPNTRYAFWDAKNYQIYKLQHSFCADNNYNSLGALTSDKDNTFVTPDNCHYIQISIQNYSDYLSIQEYDNGLYFIPYGLASNYDNIIQSPFRAKKICIVGDSTTEGGQWAIELCRNLGAFLYINSIGGTRVGYRDSDSNAADAMCQDKRIEMIPKDSDIIIFSGGANDWRWNTLGTIDSAHDHTTFYGAYQLMLDKAFTRCPNARFVLADIIYRKDGNGYEDGGNMDDYRQAIRDISLKNCFPFLEIYRNAGINDSNEAQFAREEGDVIHKNDLGNHRIARVATAGMLANV